MIATRHEVQLVALTMADSTVAVMQFIIQAWRGDELLHERNATDEAIQAEIERSAFAQPVVSWRRIGPDDLPSDRANRDAWRDDGKAIAVDETAIPPPPKPDPRDQKIAALESRIDKVEADTMAARLP